MGTVWLDGRNMKDMKETDEHAPAPESMSLRYAAIDRDGKLSMKLSSITVCASVVRRLQLLPAKAHCLVS